jgi:hypothetical protein
MNSPEREADVYPLAQTEVGVTIAIDEIKDAGRRNGTSEPT